MNYWRFVCNAGTRPECFRRQLVGSDQQYPVSPGDTILLYDYSDNQIYGPLNAITECSRDIVSNAFGGKTPFQVRVTWDDLYRIRSSIFPQIENRGTLSRAEFRLIIERLQQNGERLVVPEWGSSMAALTDDVLIEPDSTQIAAEKKALKKQLEKEPPDPAAVEYETDTRIAREAAFRQAVRDAYDNRCAFCGERRETPDGRPEVEAAHIMPKADGGPDDIRNGIALCKLHHWAFDNGWLFITDDLRIAVTAAPARDGYEEFSVLDGQKLELPDDSRLRPATKYLG